jgi:hypothetical protein
VHAFRWLNHHLKQDDSLLTRPAVRLFEPDQLRVFEQLPEDERNTEIDRSFVKRAEPPLPDDPAHWKKLQKGWRNALRQKSFAAWPAKDGRSVSGPAPVEPTPPLDVRQVFSAVHEDVRLTAYDFQSQEHIDLRLYVAHRDQLDKPELAVLNVLDEASWKEFLATMRVGFKQPLREETLPAADPEAFEQQRGMLRSFPWVMAYVAPRGIGPTAWDQSERKQVQHRRRFYLLGQSLDGMRVWDVRRAVRALRSVASYDGVPLWLQSHRRMAGVALYAALFEPRIARLDLYQLPATHEQGPYLLNVTRYLDLPQAVAMAAEKSQVVLYGQPADAWEYPREVASRLKWDAKQLQFRELPK